MSGVLYNRVFSLQAKRLATDKFNKTIGETTTITDLRVVFDVVKTLGQEPNHCDVKLYNAAPETRGLFHKRPLQVRLDAGYDGDPHLLYRGDLRPYGNTHRVGTDWVTEFQLGECQEAYNNAFVSKTYAAGTLPKDAIKDTAKAYGLYIGTGVLEIAPFVSPFDHAFTVYGHAQKELTRLLKPSGHQWSTQNGELQILGPDDVRANEAILVTNDPDRDTGVIESPEYGPPQTQGGPPILKVRMLLYPRVLPGMKAQVQTRDVNGIFRVESVRHTGDSWGPDWTTTLALRAL